MPREKETFNVKKKQGSPVELDEFSVERRRGKIKRLLCPDPKIAPKTPAATNGKGKGRHHREATPSLWSRKTGTCWPRHEDPQKLVRRRGTRSNLLRGKNAIKDMRKKGGRCRIHGGRRKMRVGKRKRDQRFKNDRVTIKAHRRE